VRRIAYLFVSDVEVGDVHVLDRPPSDQRPVLATFALAAAGAR
jgi:hypothetical protein